MEVAGTSRQCSRCRSFLWTKSSWTSVCVARSKHCLPCTTCHPQVLECCRCTRSLRLAQFSTSSSLWRPSTSETTRSPSVVTVVVQSAVSSKRRLLQEVSTSSRSLHTRHTSTRLKASSRASRLRWRPAFCRLSEAEASTNRLRLWQLTMSLPPVSGSLVLDLDQWVLK